MITKHILNGSIVLLSIVAALSVAAEEPEPKSSSHRPAIRQGKKAEKPTH
jgi:hypothetical protein